MENGNKIKNDLLGMPHGTAVHQLRKKIMFDMMQRLGEDICFRCGKKIENIDYFSVEHKTSWQSSENPKEAFFDLENISFSHLNCNISAGERKTSYPTRRGENHPMSKLTQKQVEEIRDRLKNRTEFNKISLDELAKEYNISQTQIRNIRDNKKWMIYKE
jgi:hypothetical protein